jgi:hypothetical protein
MVVMNPSIYINAAIQMVTRAHESSNLLDTIVGAIQWVLNYNSMTKLNRYRYNLYVQQFERMEGFIAEGSPYDTPRGERMNKRF